MGEGEIYSAEQYGAEQHGANQYVTEPYWVEQDREEQYGDEQYEDLFQDAGYEEEQQERGRGRERRMRRRVARQSESEGRRRRSSSKDSRRSGSSKRSRSRDRRSGSRDRRSGSRDQRSRSRGRTRPRRTGKEHYRLTHQQNRLQTCVLCWRRGGRKGSKAVAVRPVTSKLAAALRSHTHHKDYSEACASHPAGICTTDLKKLLDLQKVAEGRSGAYVGRDPRHEWAKLKLVDLAVPDPDTAWDECECPMCYLGHFNPVGKAGNTRVKAVLNPAGGPMDIEYELKVEKKKNKVNGTMYAAQCT